jgi:hypothetical protein
MLNSLQTLSAAMLAAALGACSPPSTAPVIPAHGLIGCWQGQDYQPVVGETSTWLMQRKQDGTFQIEFRTPSRPAQHETGLWKVDGQIYTTVTMTINGKPVDLDDPQFTDAYLLREVAPVSMAYHHSRMNVTFRSTKVACPGGT